MKNMTRLAVLVLTLILASSFGGNKKWIVLFDGTNIDAWRNYKSETVSDKWQIVNNELMLTEKGGGDIMTKETFKNFVLELEWKISEGGNSGIFFNVHESDEHNKVYSTGPEVQILCESACEGRPDNECAGANYAMHAPTQKVAKPTGEWNKVKLVVKNGKVQQWLNGVKVVEYELWSEDWEKRVNDCKFKNFPGYGKYKEGHIALQDHGNQVWFKNIRIKRLKD